MRGWTMSALRDAIGGADTEIITGGDDVDGVTDVWRSVGGVVRERVAGAGSPGEASRLEEEFLLRWVSLSGPPLEREVAIIPGRRYRADFAISEIKIMIEIDGGQWSKDPKAHGYGAGMERDFVKQNLAAIHGWRVFRFANSMIMGADWDRYIGDVIEFARGELGKD